MSQYLITLTGHLKRDRPDNFPALIYDQEYIQANSKDEIIKAVSQLTMRCINNQGMVVFLDPSAMLDVSKINTDKMFVPMGMMTHITAEVQLLSQPLPMIGEDGLVVPEDGEEIVKQ